MYHLSEHCVHIIQMRRSCVCYKELTVQRRRVSSCLGKPPKQCKDSPPVGVGALVGHGEDAPPRVAEGRMELVVEALAPDALAALARARGVPSLDHEALDVAVEERLVVLAARRQRQKVAARPRRLLHVQLHLDVAQRGVQRQRHVSLSARFPFPKRKSNN